MGTSPVLRLPRTSLPEELPADPGDGSFYEVGVAAFTINMRSIQHLEGVDSLLPAHTLLSLLVHRSR